jgi:hypothetical protein
MMMPEFIQEIYKKQTTGLATWHLLKKVWW